MIKFLPNSNFLKTELRKSSSRESKAISVSIVTRNPPILNQSLISIMSEINIPFYHTILVCREEIDFGKTAFNLFEIALDKIFVSTFNKENGLQFLMYHLSRSFFSVTLITACLL